MSVAPDSQGMNLAQDFYQQLSDRGIEVILDDRDDRPGVKFKDADLIGFPIRVGIGEKSLARGEVEIKLRRGELTSMKREEAEITLAAHGLAARGGGGWRAL